MNLVTKVIHCREGSLSIGFHNSATPIDQLDDCQIIFFGIPNVQIAYASVMLLEFHRWMTMMLDRASLCTQQHIQAVVAPNSCDVNLTLTKELLSAIAEADMALPCSTGGKFSKRLPAFSSAALKSSLNEERAVPTT